MTQCTRGDKLFSSTRTNFSSCFATTSKCESLFYPEILRILRRTTIKINFGRKLTTNNSCSWSPLMHRVIRAPPPYGHQASCDNGKFNRVDEALVRVSSMTCINGLSGDHTRRVHGRCPAPVRSMVCVCGGVDNWPIPDQRPLASVLAGGVQNAPKQVELHTTPARFQPDRVVRHRRMLLNPRHAVDCLNALLKCSQEKVGREEGSRQGRGQTTPRSAVGEQGTAGRWARLPSTVTLSFPLLLSTYPLSSHSLLSVPSYPATLSSHSDNVNITHHCFQVQLHT
jgi:hypothetical protein